MLSKLKSYLYNPATFLFASTIIVNAGNYGINLILGRILGPNDFAEASILATLVLMLSFIAIGFQLTSAKYCAGYVATNENDQLKTFIRWLYKKSYFIGIALCIILIALIIPLQQFLKFRSIVPLLLIIVCIPLYFHFSVSRGWMQGEEKFKSLAFTYIMEMVVRLIITFFLVFLAVKMIGGYTSEAVAIGFFISFISTYFFSKKDPGSSISGLKKNDLSMIYKFVVVIGFYEFSQILINNSDVILVKHFFGNEEAGLYAALALIGRVVFFATWTVVTLLFPKVVQKEKRGESHIHLFWGSLSVVGIIGLLIVVACLFMDEMIINILFGKEYLSISPLLWKYAIATTLFACANVFAYYYMSLNKYLPVILSVVAGAAQIGLIYIYHESITQVILVQIVLMTVLLISMIIYYFFTSVLKLSSTQVNSPKMALSIIK